MTDKNTGGPAFPVTLQPGEVYKSHAEFDGMTLRDYMAIHASDADVERIMLENFDHVLEVYLVTRQQARYMHADFMLEARQS